MNFMSGNYYTAESNGMSYGACYYCGLQFCTCSPDYDHFAEQREYEHSPMPPVGYQYATPPHLLPVPHPMGQNLPPAPPQAVPQAFPHYGGRGQQQPQCSHYDDSVMNDSLMTTFRNGKYTPGINNEPEVRSADIDAVFLNPIVQHLAEQSVLDEEDVDDEDDLRLDGTIDPQKLSLPMKVPCPQCSAMLKDHKSLGRHISRKHRPNLPRHYCPNCEYSTTEKKDMNRHTRSLHPNAADPKPFKCSICGTGSARLDNLRRHYIACSAKNSLLATGLY